MKKLIALALVLAMMLSMVPAVFAAENALADLAIVNPTVDYQVNPTGIEETDVKFAWAMESNAIGASQLNYQIVVREGSEEGEVVWDTGVVEDDRSVAIIYGGEALEPEARYFWDVTITDQNGSTATSTGNWFEIAPTMDDATWLMYGDHTKPAPFFRTEVTLEKEVAKASLALSSMGIYEAYINGEEVRYPDVDDIFNPGLTNYSTHVYYQTYDVTDMLKQGANAIGVMVGGGWYQTAYNSNFQSIYGPNNRAEERALLGKLVVTYTDGTKAVFTTNTETWKATTNTFILADDQWNGETQDGRIRAAMADWAKVGYDTTGWEAPVAEAYKGRVLADARAKAFIQPHLEQKPVLAYTYNPAETTEGYRKSETEWYWGGVVKHEVDPEKDIALKAGDVLVLDMSQNMVGFNNITVTGPEGATVTVRHAEYLNDGKDMDYFLDQGGRNGNTGSDGPEGTLYFTSLRSAQSTDRYILTGAGNEVFQPYFTFHGYRFVQITADQDITLHDLRGIVISSVGEEIGLVETSNADVNQLISNTKWSQRGNYLSIPTDCPQRNERAGWTGDTQLFSQTAVMNFDVNTFLEKHIDDMSEFYAAYGYYADVMPKVVSRKSLPNCGWSDAGVIVPWVLYKQTGDIRIIEQAYQYMAAYTKDVAVTGYNTRTYGDWLAPWPASLPFTSGAYELYINYIMTDMAELMGNEEDAQIFADRAETVRLAMIDKYIDEEGNLLTSTADADKNGNPPKVGLFPAMTCMDNAQTGILWALKLGIYDSEETRQALINNLLINIRNEGQLIRPDGAENSLSVGFLGVNVLLPVLTDIGEAETAYTLLLQDQNPSWLYSVKQGATTIWERWDAYNLDTSFGTSSMNSFNHYSYGACLEWMYNYMSGIKADEANPGYKHVILQPTVDPAGRIDWVNGSYDSLYGKYISNWTSVNGEIATYEAAVPANTSATLYLPAAGKDVVLPAALVGLVDVVGDVEHNGETVLQMELPAGSYNFTFTEETVEVALADEELIVTGIEVALTGAEEVTLDAEELTYTVSVADAIDLATATLTFEVDGLEDVAVTGLNGWNVITTTEEDGVVTAVLYNLEGTDGAADIAAVTAPVPAKVGEVSVVLAEAVLSAYVGNSEAFIDAIVTAGEAVTNVTYSTYDVNQDGVVNQLDITRAQRFFGKADDLADVDGSGEVDITDLVLILNNYSK